MMKMKMIKQGVAGLALAFALAPASVLAQTAPDIEIDQVQLGDVFGHIDVVIDGGAEGDAAAVGLSYGNVISVETPYDGTSLSSQDLRGSTSARATLTSDGDIGGAATATSTAYGNSSLYVAEGATVSGHSAQTSSGAIVESYSSVDVRNAGAISASSVSAVNMLATEVSDGGDLDASVVQTSSSRVFAQTDVNACCSGTSTLGSATAATNIYDATASGNSRNIHDVTQTSTGPSVTARNYVTQPDGTDIASASSATGNSVLVDSAFGYTQLTADQDNSSVIVSEAEIYLDDWEGTSSVSAYGVGNSTLAYNTGSATDAYVDQNNTGAVYATTDVSSTGVSDGVMTSSTTAIGNAYTGSVCVTCGSNAQLGGAVKQVNSGNVYSYASGGATANGGYYGSAAAIGNSATFTTQGGGH